MAGTGDDRTPQSSKPAAHATASVGGTDHEVHKMKKTAMKAEEQERDSHPSWLPGLCLSSFLLLREHLMVLGLRFHSV